MTAAIDSFTYNIATKRTFIAQMNRTSTVAGQPLDGSGPLVGSYQRKLLSTTAAASQGGGNLLFSDIITVPASSTYTFDLRAFTDVMGRASQVMVRVKSFYAILLNSSLDSAVGTACSGVVLGNSGANGNKLWMNLVASTHTFENGSELFVWNNSAAGWATASNSKDLLFTNSDSVAGMMLLEIAGAQA